MKYCLPLLAIALFSCGEKKVMTPPPLPLDVIEVQSARVPLEADFVGQVYGYVDIPVRARVDGFLIGMHFSEGAQVKKGQLLYTIDPQPFEAQLARVQSEIAQAKTGLAKAESDLNRIRPLAEIKAVSQAELDGAIANYDAAIASVDAAEANERMARIDLSYTRMRSPINGIIGKSMAQVGEYVGKSPNPVILSTISKTDSILVEFFFNEDDYLKIARYDLLNFEEESEEQVVSFKLNLILSDNSIFDYEGSVVFANREIDPNTGSLLIQTAFPNPDRLIKPGQFAKVRLTIIPNQNRILIPQRSVKEFQGIYSVFTVNAENIVEEKIIQITDTYRDYYVLNSGLEDGTRVVLEGIQKVRNKLEIDPKLVEFESKFPVE